MKSFFTLISCCVGLFCTMTAHGMNQTVTFCIKNELNNVSAGKIMFAFKSREDFDQTHDAIVQSRESKCVSHTYHGSPKRLMFYFLTSPIQRAVTVNVEPSCNKIFNCNTPIPNSPAYCYAKKKTFENDSHVYVRLILKDASVSKSKFSVLCERVNPLI